MVELAVVFVECCLGRAFLLYTPSFVMGEVDLGVPR